MKTKSLRHTTRADVARWVSDLIYHHNLKAFYNSPEWQDLRSDVLREAHYECQICKEKGRLEEADTVHHIKPVKQRPDLALTRGNLIALCPECHYKIHHPTPDMSQKRRRLRPWEKCIDRKTGKQVFWDDEKW